MSTSQMQIPNKKISNLMGLCLSRFVTATSPYALGPYACAMKKELGMLQASGITHIICVRQEEEARFVKPNFPQHFDYLYGLSFGRSFHHPGGCLSPILVHI